jgi:hypothetical protein
MRAITSLTKEFDNVVESWDNVAEVDQTLNELTARLLKRKLMLNLRGEVKTEELDTVALLHQGKPTYGRGKPRAHEKKTIECFFCHKIGHMKRNCHKWKSSQRSGEDSSPAAGSQAVAKS